MKEMNYTPHDDITQLHSGTYLGHDYVIADIGGRHMCAYIRLKKTDYGYMGNYDDVGISVHGGLTYAHETAPTVDKRGWWVGWDYAHFGDYSGLISDGKKWTTAEVYEHVKDATNQLIASK